MRTWIHRFRRSTDRPSATDRWLVRSATPCVRHLSPSVDQWMLIPVWLFTLDLSLSLSLRSCHGVFLTGYLELLMVVGRIASVRCTALVCIVCLTPRCIWHCTFEAFCSRDGTKSVVRSLCLPRSESRVTPEDVVLVIQVIRRIVLATLPLVIRLHAYSSFVRAGEPHDACTRLLKPDRGGVLPSYGVTEPFYLSMLCNQLVVSVVFSQALSGDSIDSNILPQCTSKADASRLLYYCNYAVVISLLSIATLSYLYV